MAILPPVARGHAPSALMPEGVCGSPQNNLEESRSGSAMLQHVLSKGTPWGDKALAEYVNRLGQNLARSSGSQQVFAFYVLYNPEVNAQALPGGYVVINSGAISLAENEAELAYVLSHEIAHENFCDWHVAPREGSLFELIRTVPIVSIGGPASIAIAAGSGWASTAARARFFRSNEERADHFAANYLARAGYDPNAAVRFLLRLQAEQDCSGGAPSGLLASHPRTVDRRKRLERIIPDLLPPENVPHDEGEFLRMRRAVREYDEMYSRLVGVRVPGQDVPVPELSRRPPAAAEGGTQ